MKIYYKSSFIYLVLTCVFMLVGGVAKSQLLVNGNLTPDSLAKLISGEGVQISNAQVDCGSNGYGMYNASNTNLGVNTGLLLTTGSINNAIGPNNVSNKSTNWTSPINGNPQTYPLLNNYSNRTTYEYCEFEFDIVPQGDTISFDFVFASEEYEEWVGSQYNDVFGFFISGPGIIPDPGTGGYKNIALIPNSSTPVTINDVNQNQNTAYYQNNNNGQHVQYDGYTRGLKAISEVVPCATYHLILVVADASDKIYDSGVFIEKISSNNILLLSSTAGNLPHMVEGCNDGTVTFKRPLGSSNTNPLSIQYWLDGTATNGTDYNQIGSNPSPLVPKNIIIPAGIDSANLPITTIADALPEISEYIMVYLGNPYCSNSITDSLQFFIQDSLFPTVNPVVDSICYGNSVQLQATGGANYSWSPSAGLNNASIANPIATPSTTTTYTMTTTASLCSESRNVKIYVSDMSLSFTSSNVDCNGNNNGTIQLIVANGLAPYSFAWNGPNGFTSTNQNLNSLAPGNYNVVVTDAVGCTVSGSISITEPQALSSTISSAYYNGGYNISCNGLFDGSISLTVNGGTPSYTYSWTGPNGYTSASQNPTGLEAGSYNVIITDNNGCVITNTISLTQPPVLNASISNIAHVGCKDEATGSALSNVVGGTPSYTYSWNTSPIQTTPAATNLYAGSYIVTVTDANGCADTASVIISEPLDSLTASITSVTHVLCKGDSTGFATVTPNGGTPSYTYSWNTSPTQTTPTATNLLAGNYTVTVVDANGCSTALPVTINEPQMALNVLITNSVDVSCKGDSNGLATALANGGSGTYTYSWNTVPIQTTPTATNLPAGTYIVTVTDNNGCLTPATASVVINEPSQHLATTLLPSTYLGGYNVSCNGANDGSITQIVSGGTSPYSFAWSGPNVYSSSSQNISGLVAGTYYLQVTDTNGCFYDDTLTLIEPPIINIAVVVSDATCPAFTNGSIDITVTGGTPAYTYSWTGPGAFTSNLEDISGLAAGDYDLTVTDNNGCTKTIRITVSQPGTLTLTNVTSSFFGGYNVSCNGASDGTIDITAGGGTLPYNFSWTGPGGFTSTLEDINGLQAGPYQVIFTDNNGCFVSDSIYLSEPAQIQASLNPSVYNGNYNISCNGVADGSISAIPSGGVAPYTYSWTGPGAFSSNNQNISGLVAGIYYLQITDTNGCIGVDSLVLTEPDSLIGTLSSVLYQGGYNISCYGLSNGSIDLTVNGGTSAYIYNWTGPGAFSSNLEDINNLSVGNYFVQITDNNGCVDTTSIVLTQPDSLILNTIISNYNGGYNVSCNGFTDGGIDLTVVGGTPNFTYNWSNGSIYEDLSNISAGSYTVIVTDTNNCSATKTINLNQPPALQSGITSPTYIGGNNISCDGLQDGSIDLQVNGGTPSYTYAWIGPGGFNSVVEDPTNVGAGTYQVTITDTNGCSLTDFITLTSPAPVSVSLSSPSFNGGYNLSCFNDTSGAIDLTVSGGIPVYTYSWTGPNAYMSNMEDINGLLAGTYYVIVTDTNSCTSFDSITITEPNPLQGTFTLSNFIGGNNVSCSGANDGSIDLTVNGGNPNYNFLWTGPNNFNAITEDISNLIAGTYSLTVTDTNGCSYDTTITLTEPSLLNDSIYAPTFIGGFNLSCAESNDGVINAFVNGGSSPYIISWSGPNAFTSSSFNISGLESGTYIYTVTDANMCSLTDSVILTQPDSLKSTLTTTLFPSGHNIACKGDTSGLIFNNVQGGNAGYTFSWTNGGAYASTNQNPDSLNAGTYYLLLTDTNGCTWNDSITLTEPQTAVSGQITPSIYPSGDNIRCYGTNTGDLSVIASGGTPSYIIDWRGPNGYSNDSSYIDSLYAGVYDVAIIDTNGCSIGLSFELIQPDTMLYLTDSISLYPNGLNVSCNGSDDGSIDIEVFGGSISYTYNWTGTGGLNQTTQDINNLEAGVYYLQITDTNNCVLLDTFELSEPDSMVINSQVNQAVCGNPIGSVALFVEGYDPFTYLWTNGDTTSSIYNLPQGNYSVVVTDVFGCIDSTSFTINDLPNTMLIDLYSFEYLGGYNVSTHNGNDGNIDMTIIGGTPPYTINWSNGSNDEDQTNLTAGGYTVTVTDANGCSTTAYIELTEPFELDIPTAITPNGDGANDYFVVRGLEVYPNNNLLVFNRWGNKVFNVSGYKNDWNGVSNNGKPLPEGTYFIILKVNNDEKEMKGYLEIRR